MAKSPPLIRLRLTRFLCSTAMLLGTLGSAAAAEVDPLDWPYWRGPEMNSNSRETGLVDRWSPDGENLLWKREDMGTRSTPIVMNGKLYFLARSFPETPKEGEKVVCLDAATGKTLWENTFNVFLSDVPDTRVAWSSVIGDPATGRVYAQGVCGLFLCIDGETGKTIWSHSLCEEYGLLSTYGGRTNFPVVFEDLVIVSAVVIGWGDMAKPAHRFVAFDKSTGEAVWFTGTKLLPKDTTYSSPVLTVFNGQAALVFASGDGGVWAFQPRTGVPIWNYQLSLRGVNTSPTVIDDVVYIGQSEENVGDNTMGLMVALNGVGKGDISKTNELWRNKEMMIGRAAPVMVGAKLLVVDDSAGAFLLDPKTGKPIGKKQKLGTMTRGTPLVADGKIYTCENNGRWYILEAGDGGLKIIHKLRLRGEAPASPIVSHGRIYMATTECMYCIGTPDHKPTATERPPAPQESPVSEDNKPAHVQLVPVESLIKPGEKLPFEVRLFNARGQLLGKASEVSFAVDGGGSIDPKGIFQAESAAEHRGVNVSAKVGALTGTARIRIVPDLPWSFDFSEGDVPITWVGARYRHIVRDVDGEKVMVKITTIPLGTRSQSWMGHTDFHDYTIQADVKGSIAEEKMPDIGLIAQRYTLDMMGRHQQLQIRCWPPQLARFSQTIPFAWKPDVWYTMKFRAANEEGKAVLRGKVWERGQPEPKEWSIEAVDVAPNTVGSPGLFGNATDAEIFLDNIKVYSNE